MINKVTLVGHLGKDPEVRHLEGDNAVANFSLATSEAYTDKTGNRVKQTEWHNIEMWGGLAKIAEKYLKKGNLVYIEGKIKTDEYEKDGVKKYSTKIRALSMTMLGGGNGSGENTGNTNSSASTNSSPVSSEQTFDSIMSDDQDDLPF